MSGETVTLAARVTELRQAFDRSFTMAPATAAAEVEGFVAIRLSSDPFALRLADISGLFADKTIVSLPTSAPALIGVAGFRGSIMPVCSLPALLGYAGEGASRRRARPGANQRDVTA